MNPWYRFEYKIVEALTLGVWHCRPEGRENVPLTGGVLAISNHVSFADPTTVGWAMGRETQFLARSSLFKPPVMDKLLPLCNAHPVNRDAADVKGIRLILSMLKAGELVLMFPEGTRSPDGGLREAETGAAMIACKAQVPILPCRIFGAFAAYPRTRKFPGYAPMRVRIGEPFRPPEGRRFTKEQYEELARRMTAEIGKLE
ncbi:MAG: lysophospholipid acyltransferase family protein [Verrucomicrobiota bacterium]